MDNDTPVVTDNVVTQNSLLNDTNGADTPDTPVVTDTPAVTDDILATDTSFLDSLPEDMKGNASLTNFKSVEDLANSFLEQKKLVGRKTTIPGEEATPEEWTEFYNNSGRPEEIGGYGIELPDTLKNLDGSDDRNTAALQAAYDSGLSKRQAEVFFDKIYTAEAAAVEAQQAQVTETLSAAKEKLTSEWGEDFSKRAEQVTALEKQLGVFDEFEAAGLNANPALLVALGKIAKDLKVDSSIEKLDSGTTDVSAEEDSLRSEMMQANKDGDTVKRDKIRRQLAALYRA